MKSQKSKNKLSSSQKKTPIDKIKNENDFFDNILDINIKKPGSAYNYFTREYIVKNKCALGEASKVCSAKWEKMSTKEKEKYDLIVEEEMERYNKHYELVKKYLLDIKKIEPQVSPYMAYKQSYVYDAINKEDRDPQEARKSAKQAWEDLSEKSRQKWIDAFEANKEFLEELKNFKPGKVNAYSMFVKDKVANEGMNFKKAASAWENATDKQKKKYEKYAEVENKERKHKVNLWEVLNGVKPKRPVGAFRHYFRELSEAGALEGVTGVITEVSKRYKALPDNEKEKYEKLAKQEMLEYTIKLGEYKKFISQRFGRAPSAMNLYVQDKSPDYADKDLEPGELFKLLNEKWKNESESVKEKYEKRAEEEKAKYKEHVDGILSRNPPKKNKNAYNIYIAENSHIFKEKNPKMVQSEIFSLCSEKWSKLTEKEKAPYEEKAELDKERYEKEIKEYEEETGMRGRTKNTQRYTDDKRTSASKEKGYSKYQSQKSTRSKSQVRKSKSKSKKTEDDKENKRSSSKKSVASVKSNKTNKSKKDKKKK